MNRKQVKFLQIKRYVVDEEAERKERQKWISWWEEYRKVSFFKRLWMWFCTNPRFSEDGRDCRPQSNPMRNWFSYHRKENPDHIAILEGNYIVDDGWRVIAISGDEHSDITLTLERDVEGATPYR